MYVMYGFSMELIYQSCVSCFKNFPSVKLFLLLITRKTRILAFVWSILDQLILFPIV